MLLYIQVCMCGLKKHTSSSGSLTTEDSVDVDVLRDLNSTQVTFSILASLQIKLMLQILVWTILKIFSFGFMRTH